MTDLNISSTMGWLTAWSSFSSYTLGLELTSSRCGQSAESSITS